MCIDNSKLSIIHHKYVPSSTSSIWVVDTKENSGFLWEKRAILSKHELVRGSQFCFFQDKKNYINSHVALRILIGSFLGQDPRQLDITFPRMRAPVFKNNGKFISLSISRSNGVAAIAICVDRKIGVDLEKIVTLDMQSDIVKSLGSETENSIFTNLDRNSKEEGFWRWWVSKEACLKSIGSGFSYDPSSIGNNFLLNRQTINKTSDYNSIYLEIEPLHISSEKYFLSSAITDGGG